MGPSLAGTLAVCPCGAAREGAFLDRDLGLPTPVDVLRRLDWSSWVLSKLAELSTGDEGLCLDIRLGGAVLEFPLGCFRGCSLSALSESLKFEAETPRCFDDGGNGGGPRAAAEDGVRGVVVEDASSLTEESGI